MRPVRLVIQAFGAYAGRQVVDFRELGPRSFFLISGPTGSGKTTVLDAICFALYGVASGSEREARGMRSHHADPATPTCMELDFVVRGRRYKVRRSLDHEVEGRKTPLKADATLWDMEGCDIDGEGRVLATGLTRVTQHVTSLLGLGDKQFRQVVLLPQGQFRQALTAGSQERQEIFQLLFDTVRYLEIERALLDDVAKLKAGLRDLDAAIRADLERAGVGTREELESKIQEESERFERAKDAEAAAHKAVKVAEAALKAGERAMELHQEVAAAQEQLDQIEAQRPAVEALRRELALAEKALTCAAAHEAFQFAVAEEEHAAGEHAAAAEALVKAKAKHDAAQAGLYRERSPERAHAREEAQRKVMRLAELEGAVEEIEAARESLVEASRRCEEAQGKAEQASKELEQAKESLGRLEEERNALRLQAAAAGEHRQQLKALETAMDRAASLERLERELKKAREEADAAEARARAADEEFRSARARADALREAMMRDQAAFLAASLAEGEPCPVCGSVHHPAPAKPSDGGKLVGAAEVEQAESAARRKQAAAEAAAKAFQEAGTALSVLKGRVQALKESQTEPEASVKELTRRHRDVSAALDACLRAEDRLAQVEEELKRARDDVANRSETQLQWESERVDAVAKEAAARAALDSCSKRVPVELRSMDALRDAKERAEKERAALDKALEAAMREHEDAVGKLSAAESALKAAQSRVEAAAKRKDEASRRLQSSVERAGFESVAHFLGSIRDADAMEGLRSKVSELERDLAAATGRLKRAKDAAKGVDRPDLEQLRQTYEAADRAEKEAITAKAEAKARCQELERARGALLRHLEERRQLEEEYAVVNRVAEVTAGRAPNRLGMNFERFVLASMLDQVAETATARLQVMSRGRYRLRRTDQRRTARSHAGLELEVYDHYTGRERPVSTLSGGEGFMASLALALGLSDVVQARSGGIRLDTIFIDEGFGTLDPESLDLAIDTLVDLQLAGSRLVGIISHVPELAERIDARLEVTMTERGSRARFVVG